MNEPIWMQLGTTDPLARAWNKQLWGSGGQRSSS